MSMKQFLAKVRRRTWVIVGSVVVVLGVAAGVMFGVVLPKMNADAQTIETTATASLETLEQSVAASGTLSALVDEDVDFAVSGTVLTVDVAEGAVVTVGQQLATVDTLQLNAELLEAKATLAEAKARLADDSDTSAALDANEAAVEVAQAAVDSAQAAISDATLVAPVAGTVTSVGIEVGDSVGSSSTAAPNDPASTDTTSTVAFHIVGTDAWEVDVTVSEADLALIAKDDQVEFSTEDGTTFFGTLSTIGLIPDTSSGVAEYPVSIAVTGTAEGLFDGVSVTASIIYERRTEVLTVPSAAVTTDADGQSTVTLVASDGTKTETEVSVGESAGGLTEIVDGIAEGDTVLVASFTPGEGNQGEGGFPTNGEFPEGFQIPDGFEIPEGGLPGGGPGGGQGLGN